RYATLSHCWGPPTSKPPLRTTKFNQIGHSKGIALATLTLNFLDAVLICRKLGLDYIWIDSLCIIQDDSADWEAEAAKMADIYRGSYLNIAAAAAADAHGGIIGLTSLPDPKDRLTNINYSSAASDTETLILQEGLGVGEYWQINKTSHPYFGRGWVLQELALSPRTVLFTAGQMFWQCRSCFVSEDAYARRQLSYLSDTAPAIAGLVDFFSKAAHNTPMLGLWKETLRYDLLWAMR
ncbi:heterokaryon incompatibility protein-domain-containing protein, partial [Lasiosphaeris hirsuta]